eukprot:6179575-Pleurochrysis_carterae.AAC.1
MPAWDRKAEMPSGRWNAGPITMKAPGELGLRPRFTPTHARDSMRILERVGLGLTANALQPNVDGSFTV